MDQLKKVLFVAYQFPPRSGPGVHRSLNFVRQLKEFGYLPVVITITDQDIKNCGFDRDEKLLMGLPEDISIIRLPAHEPLGIIKRATRLRLFRFLWFFLYPYFWERSQYWGIKNYKAIKELVLKEEIRMVYTSSGPFCTLELGQRLKHDLGLKWLADLRDPFTDGYQWDFPSKLHWLFMRRWEKKILGKPDVLVVNTPEVKKLYEARGIKPSGGIHAIGNGF